MSKQVREVISDDELDAKINRGVDAIYRVAKAAYGPGAGNAMLELPYGDPMISRDGVTNVKNVYLEDGVENSAARVIVQASKKNNTKVGDGTTAVVILARHLYKEARKLIAAGYNRMQVAKMLEKVALDVIKQVDEIKIEVDSKLLKHVAVVSAGDEALGHMIADVIGTVGLDGGVIVEDFAGSGTYSELVEGLYFRRGFTHVNLINDPTAVQSIHQDIDILITDKPLRTAADIVPLIGKLTENGNIGAEIVIIGDVQEEALATLILNKLKGVLNATVVDVPTQGAMRALFLEDIAVVTGGKVLTIGANANSFTKDMLGGADKVIINELETTIIGSQGASEDADKRIKDLRQQLAESDSQGTREALRDRISKLTGKVAIIRVGGATEVEQVEVKLRADDAISAVRAALEDGIVPGGGTVLLRAKTDYFGDAFKAPFRLLVENSGYNTEEAVYKVLSSPLGNGYNLREDILLKDGSLKTPVDMLKAGVVDPASVIKEVVRNSTSVVSKLITATVWVGFKDRAEKFD